MREFHVTFAQVPNRQETNTAMIGQKEGTQMKRADP